MTVRLLLAPYGAELEVSVVRVRIAKPLDHIGGMGIAALHHSCAAREEAGLALVAQPPSLGLRHGSDTSGLSIRDRRGEP